VKKRKIVPLNKEYCRNISRTTDSVWPLMIELSGARRTPAFLSQRAQKEAVLVDTFSCGPPEFTKAPDAKPPPQLNGA
jgi:hypothetical protein